MAASNPPTGHELLQLRDFLASNFNVSHWADIGLLTGTSHILDSHSRLYRSLRFNDEDYPANVLDVLRTIINYQEDNADIINNYIAHKFPTEGVLASSEHISGARIVFTPLVFKVPDGRPDPTLLSVMMPFSPELRPVFDAISLSAKSVGLTCQRVDDIWLDTNVIQDVFSLIYRSFIVVCDFSGRNPNVFYEAGIAHTLGKHVIPITQSRDDVPFDLRHHRNIHYLNNSEGRTQLGDALAERIRTLVSSPGKRNLR